MKRRLSYVFTLSLFLVVFLSSSVANLLPFIAPTTVSAAAGDNFIFYYEDGSLNSQATKSIKSDLLAAHKDGGGIGPDDVKGVLSKTKVVLKGGRIGTAVLAFDGEKSNKNDIPTYKKDYYCYPTDGYRMSTDSPDNSLPYIRYTIGVTLEDNNSWDELAGDGPFTTRIGLLGNTDVGSIHFPSVQTGTSATIAAMDFKLNGEGKVNKGHDLREGASISYSTDYEKRSEEQKNYKLTNYPNGSTLGDMGKVLDRCKPNNIGDKGKATALYAALSGAKQKEWDDAMNAGGLGANVAAATSTGINGDEEAQLDCNTQFTNTLTWLLCPVVDLLAGLIEQLDNLITAQMTIETDSIFCTTGATCSAYYNAWASFRNIALGLMVIAGLVILICQALGFELLDAYTIRKTLPRLLIAAIGITLSWPLMKFFVELTNDLGIGIRHLIYAPFTQLSGELNLDFGNGLAALGGGGAILTGIAIWIPFGGLGVMFSYMLTAALAVLIAVLILVLRQIAIIMLMLIAPIAIITYVLPNTQKYYKLWWESFSKALFMFPLIAGFIATGRVFSAIAINNGEGNGLNQFIGFVAYFAPYFMIPLTVRFAGGALRNIGGFVNDRSRGGFDRLRKYRAGTSQKRIARARTKGLYRPELGSFDKTIGGRRFKGSVGGMLNKVGSFTTDADEMIPFTMGKYGVPGFKRGYRSDKAEIQHAEHEQTMKAMQEVGVGYKGGRLLGGMVTGAEHDYTKNMAADKVAELEKHFAMRDSAGNVMRHTDGVAAGKAIFRAPEGLAEIDQMADLIATSSDGEAIEAASQMRTAGGKLEHYKKSADMNRVDSRFLGLAAAAREGRLSGDDIVANHKEMLHHDKDEAMNQTNTLMELSAPKRTELARGHGMLFTEDGKISNSYKWDGETDPTKSKTGALSDKAISSASRISTQDIAAGKSETLDALEETLFAAASEHQMEYDANGNVVYKLDANGNKIKKPEGSIEAQRATQFQARIKTIAMYSSGDSDVGRKITRLWTEKLGRPESELIWGGGQPNELDRQRQAGPQDPPQVTPGDPLHP